MVKCAGVSAEPAFDGGANTQHGDMVGAVGVQHQFPAAAIGALLRVLVADIDDFADKLPHIALRDRAPEMRAEAEIQQPQVVEIDPLHRHAPQQDHAAAVMYFRTPVGDIVSDLSEREAQLGQVFVPATGGLEPRGL